MFIQLRQYMHKERDSHPSPSYLSSLSPSLSPPPTSLPSLIVSVSLSHTQVHEFHEVYADMTLDAEEVYLLIYLEPTCQPA